MSELFVELKSWIPIFKEHYKEWAGGELKFKHNGIIVRVYADDTDKVYDVPIMQFLQDPQSYIAQICYEFKEARR